MTIGWIWAGLVAFSVIAAVTNGAGNALSAATISGAKAGVELAISIAGAMILWCGVGALLEKAGITALLCHLLRPILHFIFPATKKDRTLSGHLSANICANLFGLGNAATPMGILAAKRLVDPNRPAVASDQLCRLVVLNTASIQLIPTNVAAIRAGQGCITPYDILPAVWLTSLCAASMGLLFAWLFGRLWHRG